MGIYVNENQQTDIFLWANNTAAAKDQINIELFLFNKNYTPYTTHFASDLNAQIKPLFLYDLINFVNLGAGTGISVRDYVLSDEERASGKMMTICCSRSKSSELTLDL